MGALSKRIEILEMAEAQGKELRPEHQAELDHYRQQGLTKGSIGKLGVQDNKALNEMRDAHSSALTVNRDYREVAGALDRTNMSPAKAAWLETMVPSEDGGFFDKLGAAIGQGAQGLGLLDPQTVTDYQTLRGLQSKRVMDAQIAQKGPQTEADAARLQLGEVSPLKTKDANIAVMKRGMADAVLAKRKLPFFQKWANQYGLNGVNSRGESADDAWRRVSDKVYEVSAGLAKGGTAKPVAGGQLMQADDGVMEWKPH